MQIKIQLPRTVDTILKDLNFLNYSTEIRNLAYHLQYLEFNLELLKSISHGALRASLIRQVVILVNNIVEYLLFISLRQIYQAKPKHDSIPRLIGQARSEELLSKSLAKELHKVNDLRNKLHPRNQSVELEVRVFTAYEIDLCNSTLRNLMTELRNFFI